LKTLRATLALATSIRRPRCSGKAGGLQPALLAGAEPHLRTTGIALPAGRPGFAIRDSFSTMERNVRKKSARGLLATMRQ
jgi:hypothetical protein